MAEELVMDMADEEPAELLRAPGSLDINVGNGEDSEVVTFSMTDGVTVWDDLSSEELDEVGGVNADVPIPEVPAGTYTLYVVGTVDRGDSVTMLEFTVAEDPLDLTAEDDPVLALPSITPEVIRWQLIDVIPGGLSYTFPRNPKTWTNPLKPLFLEHDVTTAPDGNVLAWQGGDRSWTFEFAGYIDTEAEYDALLYWAQLRRRFFLKDHRQRLHYVTFDNLDITAKVVPNKPWAHDYKVTAVHFFRAYLEEDE